MNRHDEKALSRSMDGELETPGRIPLETALRTEPELARTKVHWASIRTALQETVPTPDAELFWQGTRRAIRMAKPIPQANAPVWGFRFAWLAAVVVLVISWPLARHVWMQQGVRSPVVTVESVDSDLPGATTLVYEDRDLGCAMVWVSADDMIETSKGT